MNELTIVETIERPIERPIHNYDRVSDWMLDCVADQAIWAVKVALQQYRLWTHMNTNEQKTKTQHIPIYTYIYIWGKDIN